MFQTQFVYNSFSQTQKEKPECVPVFMEEPQEFSEGIESANYARNKVCIKIKFDDFYDLV